MRIGYLQLGPTQHGICRYGRLLAAEGCKRPNLDIIEASVILTEDYKRNREMLVDAAHQLNSTEIVHVQYSLDNNKELWGQSWSQFSNLLLFRHHCVPPLIATLHDIYNPPVSLKNAAKFLYGKLRHTDLITQPSVSFPQIPVNPKKFIQYMYGVKAISLRWFSKQVKSILVCSQEEANLLSFLLDNHKTKVIPHFVERRTLSISSKKAKAALKLDEDLVVTLLGFIHGRKGHQLLVEALPDLPKNVKVVFAGAADANNKLFFDKLLAFAKEKGVDGRLRVTGYLSEEELELYLIASDLAVCPFKSFSASGSLSTWISAARPILAYDLPQIAQYNKLEQGAIKTFRPYTPAALAKAIREILPLSQEYVDPAIAHLRKKLSLPTIFDKHLNCYTCAITRSH